MKVYYDKDADLSLIKGKNVTIVGEGASQYLDFHMFAAEGKEIPL